MDALIDRKFKRNVYGLSDWTKTVKKVHVIWNIETVDGVQIMTPEIIIEAQENPPSTYSLKEIVFF